VKSFKPKRYAYPLAVLLTVAALSSPALAETPAPRTLAITDLAKLRAVADPQVSPDGRWIAYTVGTVDTEKDKRDTDLYMVSWDGTDRIRLTSTPESSESRPRWSPDGRYLAFLTKRGDDDEAKKLGAQVWLLDRRGGEAQKVTTIKGGVSSYAWSPDGKRLVLVVNDFDPSSDPEKKEGWKRKTAPPIVIDRYHFKQDREGYLASLHTHLQLFDVESQKSEPLTTGAYDESNVSWSPDGRQIAFISNREQDPDRAENTDLFVIEAKPGAQPRQLTTFPGPDDGVPSWSPDSQSIAYLQGDEPKFSAYQLNKLAVIPAAGGSPRLLTVALDRAVQEPLVWTADGKNLSFVVQDDRVTWIGRMPAAGGTAERLATGPASERRVVSALSPRKDGAFALLSATASMPDEVYVYENGALRQVTHENDWLRGVALATVEDFTCRAKDGNEVHGLLFKPPAYAQGQKYPTLLNIHGGPNSQDQHSFSFERQFLAANGYAVLAVNYRGSAGRGAAYQKAIFADWGNKEVLDLLGAVDYAITSGIADPDRLGVGGWSYGGILTDYVTASDPRFKAAVAGAGSALQLSMYGSDQYTAQYDLELGPPWKNLEPWLRVSYPFLHADRIRTPTLYLGGQSDFNVPIIGGEQMYQALRSMGVDTQLVIYPGQYHGITMPSYAADRLERYVAWYDKYLKRR
jgi:dipeptidyl aminopeptidase/acylaminoacyl peptidase